MKSQRNAGVARKSSHMMKSSALPFKGSHHHEMIDDVDSMITVEKQVHQDFFNDFADDFDDRDLN
eukprot:CAMPEP_0119040920 /NCGR_PEP_ID=MMETSP1177-20130426/10988_1 /TAXON_ID=2985 /ORGANISM="Ochromonas sp, Strain CCMP1899" /LENGTH=64 /DNA_ID=CAMNT_0007006457 /DNA_START=44 /DNA_END=238 /DNA_ORIENTATION=-